MAASSLLAAFLLFVLLVTVESRPPPKREDLKILNSMFGSHLASLIEALPPSDDITEGSAQRTPVFEGLVPVQEAGLGRNGRHEKVPKFFFDLLKQQSKMGRRNRKSMVGGRGCFGMKMDRIGSVSGLGC